jgi:hypothetical protein
MMNQEIRDFLSKIVDVLESLWLENQAMRYLLERQSEIPNWHELVLQWREREASKTRARERFVLARNAIRLAQSDSEALESLLTTLQERNKPN